MIDRRFPTALQMMQSLALAARQGLGPVSSSEFAKGLGANPVLVRRLLATLARAGLVRAILGRNGGVELSRDAASIRLSEIYNAAVDNKEIWPVRPNLPHRCIVSSNFEGYFAQLADEADAALQTVLANHSLEDSLDRLLSLGDPEPVPAAAE